MILFKSTRGIEIKITWEIRMGKNRNQSLFTEANPNASNPERTISTPETPQQDA
jgi:hypothetical protein